MEGQIVFASVSVSESVGTGRRPHFHHFFLAVEGNVEDAEVPVVIRSLGINRVLPVESGREQRHRLALVVGLQDLVQMKSVL